MGAGWGGVWRGEQMDVKIKGGEVGSHPTPLWHLLLLRSPLLVDGTDHEPYRVRRGAFWTRRHSTI